jgi:hypothetical protein
MFTGSTATGQAVIRSSADTVKRLTLELGGNDAGIVLPDVDPEAIAEGLFWGAFINTGQTCAALKRLYVHTDVYDEVCAALTEVARAMPMAAGSTRSNVLGPAAEPRAVRDRRRPRRRPPAGPAADPARRRPRPRAPGPLLPDRRWCRRRRRQPAGGEEQFGPALPIVRYDDVEQAVAMANRLDVGLGASVWSRDRDAARAVAARLEAGTVWINSTAAAPTRCRARSTPERRRSSPSTRWPPRPSGRSSSAPPLLREHRRGRRLRPLDHHGQGADATTVTIGVVQGEHVAQALASIRKAGTVVLTGLGDLTAVGAPISLGDLTLMQKRLQGSLFVSPTPATTCPACCACTRPASSSSTSW